MNFKTWQIIKEPIITEKTHQLSQNKCYVFATDYNANKTEIKEAFEFLFSVKIISVNTKIVHPKSRRVGRFSGFKRRRKIAIFKLAPGYHLNIFQKSQQIQNKAESKDESKIARIKDALFNVGKTTAAGKEKKKADSKQALLQKAFKILNKRKRIELEQARKPIKVQNKKSGKK